MTDRDRALLDLLAAARKVSAATDGKDAREQFAKPARLALAGLDGVLARIDAIERMERAGTSRKPDRDMRAPMRDAPGQGSLL